MFLGKNGSADRKFNFHDAVLILFWQIVKSSIFHCIEFIILGNLSVIPVIIENSDKNKV